MANNNAPFKLVALPAAAMIFYTAYTHYFSKADSKPRDRTRSHRPRNRDLSTPRGFENPGVSCFLNATIQALASCTPFMAFVNDICDRMEEIPEPMYTRKDKPLQWTMCHLLSQCSTGELSNPSAIAFAVLSFHCDLHGNDQQDAHECFNKILEVVECEDDWVKRKLANTSAILNLMNIWTGNSIDPPPIDLPDKPEDVPQLPLEGDEREEPPVDEEKLKEDDVDDLFDGHPILDEAETASTGTDVSSLSSIYSISNPFSGLCASNVTCSICNQKTPWKQNTYSCLTLPIVKLPANRRGNPKLSDCINEFQKPNSVDGYACSFCNKPEKERGKGIQRVFLSRLPPCLCLHINRLLATEFKFHKFIEFPTRLKYPRVVTRDCGRLVPSGGMFSVGPQHDYILMAVVVHHGDAGSGHYTMYRRVVSPDYQGDICWDTMREFKELDEKYSSWFHISDERVVQVSVDQVLSAQAYMLYYTQNGA